MEKDDRRSTSPPMDPEKETPHHDHRSASPVNTQPQSNGELQPPNQKKDLEKSAGQSPDSDFKVQWDGPDDPDNPRSKPTSKKWAITMTVAACSTCVTCNSSLYTTTYDQLISEFHTTREICTLGLSTFVWGLMIGPMLLAPFSEFYGRRPVYMVSYAMVFIWLIPCAVAPNIATILVTRFFDGFFASAFLSVAGGTVGDLFAPADLNFPMVVYSGSPFLGPVLGPLIGGFINQNTSWRWSFWFLLIWTGVQLVVIVFLIPETYHPVLLKRKAQRLRKETGNEEWWAPLERTDKTITKTIIYSCYRPFQLLFLEPMCLNLCLLSALLLGILYLFFGAFYVVFTTNHDFSLQDVGMSFLGLMVGMLTAIATGPLWNRNYKRLVRNNNGKSEPEFRLPPTIAGVS